MRFKVAKRDLDVALQTVVGAMASNVPEKELSGHFTFRQTVSGDKFGVEVMTFTGRVFASCPLIAAVEEPGSPGTDAFTIEGWRLKQWLQVLPVASVPEFILQDKIKSDGSGSIDGGVVTIRVAKGAQTFQSLDPLKFPFWDETLKKAESKATVPPERLAAALSYSRQFASDNEGTEPQLCVCEFKNGILYSSDKKAAALIQVPGMEKSDLRVHAKDISGFLLYLGAIEGDVEVLGHEERMIFLRSSSGAIFGSTRFTHPFPVPKLRLEDVDQHHWDLPRQELQQAMGFLVAGADKNDLKLTMAPSEETAGVVILSMMSMTKVVTSLTLQTVEMASTPEAHPLPPDGFILDHKLVARILGFEKGEEVLRFGLNVYGERGLVRFMSTVHECKFLTVIPWMS